MKRPPRAISRSPACGIALLPSLRVPATGTAQSAGAASAVTPPSECGPGHRAAHRAGRGDSRGSGSGRSGRSSAHDATTPTPTTPTPQGPQ